jgi:hypothetical protein
MVPVQQDPQHLFDMAPEPMVGVTTYITLPQDAVHDSRQHVPGQGCCRAEDMREAMPCKVIHRLRLQNCSTQWVFGYDYMQQPLHLPRQTESHMSEQRMNTPCYMSTQTRLRGIG